MKGRILFRKSLQLALLIFILAGVGECFLRLALGLGNPVLIAPDAACEYILKPDQDLHRFFVHTHINHFGMRSDEIPASRKPGTLRLMFVGDSVTYGTSHVDQKDIFSEILRRELPSIVHRSVEVFNASASAWAPSNEVSFVRSRGTFDSDLVFLVLNSGDLGQPRSTISSTGDDLQLRRPSSAISELYTRAIKPRLFHETPRQDAGDNVNDDAKDTIHANLGELERLNSFVRSKHAVLVIVYIPFQKQISTSGPPSARILEEWTQSRRVPFMDISSAIAPHTIEELSLDGGYHFNTQGHRVIADAIERLWPSVMAAQ